MSVFSKAVSTWAALCLLAFSPWGYAASRVTVSGRARAGQVLLNTVRVGGVTLNRVEAIIMEDAKLPLPLLGMSFLKRSNMKSEGDRLALSQRY